jgi:hypothetical protein
MESLAAVHDRQWRESSACKMAEAQPAVEIILISGSVDGVTGCSAKIIGTHTMSAAAVMQHQDEVQPAVELIIIGGHPR